MFDFRDDPSAKICPSGRVPAKRIRDTLLYLRTVLLPMNGGDHYKTVKRISPQTSVRYSVE